MTSVLLKKGTVIIHDDLDHVKGVKTDILIQGNKIAKISTDIAVDASTEIVDVTDKIISPGFIDTHHHVWQTQLKGRHANELLFDYFTTGNWQSSNYTDADFFWGQLGGCLEAIWAGTTTVVDHAHMNYRPDSCMIYLVNCLQGHCTDSQQPNSRFRPRHPLGSAACFATVQYCGSINGIL
jgi:cytosine/adenosine deaminase-related metal-dependent hydrolase